MLALMTFLFTIIFTKNKVILTLYFTAIHVFYCTYLSQAGIRSIADESPLYCQGDCEFERTFFILFIYYLYNCLNIYEKF